MNGGGAVYHEMGSFCFSAFFTRRTFPQSDQELYRLFAEPIIRTLSDYGIMAEFGGRNDILTRNRKIYGSAQFSWYSAFVQSGTLLVNMNFEVMQRALTPHRLKFLGRPASSVIERVTSLSQETGRAVETQEVMKVFSKHFASTFAVGLTNGNLSDDERKLALQLFKSKYSTDQWNFGEKLEFEINIADKTEEGIISLSAELNDQFIKRIRLTSDLLFSQHSSLAALENNLLGVSLPEAKEIVKYSALSTNLKIHLCKLFDKLEEEAIITASSRGKELSL